MFFVDFRQSFDSVRRVKLYEAMQNIGIHLKLMKLRKMTMRFIKAKIKHKNVLSVPSVSYTHLDVYKRQN